MIHDPATGKVAVGVKVTCRANADICAEDIAKELLGKVNNLKDIEFTEVIRPRTGSVIPRCSKCIEKYGPEK